MARNVPFPYREAVSNIETIRIGYSHFQVEPAGSKLLLPA